MADGKVARKQSHVSENTLYSVLLHAIETRLSSGCIVTTSDLKGNLTSLPPLPPCVL